MHTIISHYMSKLHIPMVIAGPVAFGSFVGNDEYGVLQSNGKTEAWRSGMEHMLDSPRSHYPSPAYPPPKVWNLALACCNPLK